MKTGPPCAKSSKLLRQRRLLVSGALELAHQFIVDPDPEDFSACLPALRAVLEQLRPANLLHPLAPPVVPVLAPHWRLPPRNRFLRPGRGPVGQWADVPGVQWLGKPDASNLHAAVRLRWRLDARRHTGLWRALDGALSQIVAEAKQAAVQLSFTQLGEDWILHCSGVSNALAPVLEQALATLTQPQSHCWQTDPPAPSVQIPIRELLRQLPELSLDLAPERQDDEQLGQAALQRRWAAARWDGLVVGMAGADRSALNEVSAQDARQHSHGAGRGAGHDRLALADRAHVLP